MKGIKRKRIAVSEATTKVHETTEQILEACGLSLDYIEKVKVADRQREEKRDLLSRTKLASAATSGGPPIAVPSQLPAKPTAKPSERKMIEPPPPGDEEDYETIQLCNKDEGFMSVDEMMEPRREAKPGPYRLFGPAVEVMEAVARPQAANHSPPPRRYEPGTQLPQLPPNFGREVDSILAEARQEYDRAAFRIAAARDLARAYDLAVRGPAMSNLPARPPGTSGWILPPPPQGQVLGQPMPGQGSDRTRERRRLRVQASRRRAGLSYYLYEDQVGRDERRQPGEEL